MKELRLVRKMNPSDIASVERYLHEINKIPLISVEEEVELAVRIHNGDNDALCKLVNANLRFVVSIAVQYQNRGLSLPDLINEGNLGIMIAAQRFDETKGFKFISYAVQWIRQSIIVAISDQTRIIRIPLNHHSNMWKIKTKSEDFIQASGGVEASVEELSEKLGIAEKVLSDSISAYSTNYSSLDRSYRGGDDENCLLDVLVDNDSPNPDKKLIVESLKSEIDRVFLTLKGQESDVLSMFFGIHCQEMTVYQIAQRIGVKESRVKQIICETKKKIRNSDRCKVLETYL